MTAGIKSPPILTFHNPLNLVNFAFLGNHQPHTTMRQKSLLTRIYIFICLKFPAIFSEALENSSTYESLHNAKYILWCSLVSKCLG